MGTYIYENGHINSIQPYYVMLNGQRYNAAHFNGRIVFGQFERIVPFFVENTTSENETLTIQKVNDGITINYSLEIEYSNDTRNWYTLGIINNSSTNAITRTVVPGEILYLRCTTDKWAETIGYDRLPWGYTSIKGVSKIGGNIMSLLYGSNYRTATSLPNGCILGNLFRGATIKYASELLLPATTLTEHCYNSMFSDCTGLTTPPAILPATTLQQYCYRSMFAGCTSLTAAPTLPATTLANYCYFKMFYGCSSLTTAPALPATTLATGCYEAMFDSCTSLTTAPVLPATVVVPLCYGDMFYGASRLNYVKCLATTGMENTFAYEWLNGVSATGTFYKASGSTWSTGTSGIPSGWTVVEV